MLLPLQCQRRHRLVAELLASGGGDPVNLAELTVALTPIDLTDAWPDHLVHLAIVKEPGQRAVWLRLTEAGVELAVRRLSLPAWRQRLGI